MTAIPSHCLLRTVKIDLCQACLNGEGSECHTPGCAIWLHSVSLSFDPRQYEVLETVVLDETGRGTGPVLPGDGGHSLPDPEAFATPIVPVPEARP